MVRLLMKGRLPAAALLFAIGLGVATNASAGDAGKGKGIFAAQCSMCHSAARGGPAILGPTLFGVIGRKAGSVSGFVYSTGMKNAGFTWTDAQLRTYLPSPRTTVPGTKMGYAGLKNPTQLDDLIAYLDTLK